MVYSNMAETKRVQVTLDLSVIQRLEALALELTTAEGTLGKYSVGSLARELIEGRINEFVQEKRKSAGLE